MDNNIRIFAVQTHPSSGETVYTREFSTIYTASGFVENENRALLDVGMPNEWEVILLDGDFTYRLELTYFAVDLKLN